MILGGARQQHAPAMKAAGPNKPLKALFWFPWYTQLHTHTHAHTHTHTPSIWPGHAPLCVHRMQVSVSGFIPFGFLCMSCLAWRSLRLGALVGCPRVRACMRACKRACASVCARMCAGSILVSTDRSMH